MNETDRQSDVDIEAINRLLQRINKLCPMRTRPGIVKGHAEELRRLLPMFPTSYLNFLRITDGCLIGEPGTYLYSAEEILEKNREESPIFSIGYDCTGDRFQANSMGQVFRLVHETGEVELEWKDFTDFLKDELWLASTSDDEEED